MTEIMPIKVRSGFLRFPLRGAVRFEDQPDTTWTKWIPVTAVMSIGDTHRSVQRVAICEHVPADPLEQRKYRHEDSEPFDMCPIQVFDNTVPHAYTLLVAASMDDVLEACRMARG